MGGPWRPIAAHVRPVTPYAVTLDKLRSGPRATQAKQPTACEAVEYKPLVPLGNNAVAGEGEGGRSHSRVGRPMPAPFAERLAPLTPQMLSCWYSDTARPPSDGPAQQEPSRAVSPRCRSGSPIEYWASQYDERARGRSAGSVSAPGLPHSRPDGRGGTDALLGKGRSGSRGDDRALSPRSLEPSDVGWGQSWSERWSQPTSETTATCDRLLQLLGSGMGPAPQFLGAAIEQLEETCAECAEREDFAALLRVQQELVVRLAQQLASGDGGDGAALQSHTRKLAHLCFGVATASATSALSQLAATREQLLALSEALTEDWTRRLLWNDGEPARRQLRGAVFGEYGRAALSKGRLHAAQHLLEKALRLLRPLLPNQSGLGSDSPRTGADSCSAAIADLHLALCVTLSAAKRHIAALEHALEARTILHATLGLLVPLHPASSPADVLEDAISDANEAADDGLGSGGTATGRILIGCYHNCAVQYEALGRLKEMMESINTASQLGEWLWAGPVFEAELKRLQRTRASMAKVHARAEKKQAAKAQAAAMARGGRRGSSTRSSEHSQERRERAEVAPRGVPLQQRQLSVAQSTEVVRHTLPFRRFTHTRTVPTLAQAPPVHDFVVDLAQWHHTAPSLATDSDDVVQEPNGETATDPQASDVLTQGVAENTRVVETSDASEEVMAVAMRQVRAASRRRRKRTTQKRSSLQSSSPLRRQLPSLR